MQIELDPWELGLVKQKVNAGLLTYMVHHAGAGLKLSEFQHMQKLVVLSDKLDGKVKP